MEEEANNLAKSRRWRKQRKKKENSIPSSPTNASMESSDVMIQHPTKQHAHHNNIVSNNNSPSTINMMMDDNDALEWFLQLPSGNDRAIAMAISDVAFIRTFIELSNTKVTRDIVLKQHSHCSSTATTTTNNNNTTNHHNKSDSYSRSDVEGIESVSLDTLMDIYSRYLPVDRMPPPSLPPNSVGTTTTHIDTTTTTTTTTTLATKKEEEEVESWNEETSMNHSHRVVVPSTTTKSTVTTLHFQSGLSLPVSGTSRTREQVLKNNTTTTTTTTTTTLLHEVPSFHILKDEQRKKKAMKAVLESKTAASQALSSPPTPTPTLEPLANAEQELLKHVRLIFPSALQIFNNNTNTTLDAELITLDPDFLSSNHTIFLRMANTIIQKEQQKINNNKKSNGVFLKEKRLEQSSFHDWPQWFKKCCLTSSSLSISSLLLAAIEVSIYKSYIQEKNKQQQQHKKKNTPLKQKVLLPELMLDPLHHHVTNHSLPSLLQSWSRLHGLKNLSHGSAANVRQLVRQLISMSHADQRQRGAMTAANSFHIDDLLLVSLPFFFFFTSFCDYSPTTTNTNCHPANEPLQRWNGVIAQGKDYVTQLLKKLDLEETALTKNSQKKNNNNNILDHNTVSANVSAKENTQKTKDNNNHSNEGESSKNNNNNDTTTTTSDFKNGSSGSGTPQENSKQSSSKKKKKNKKKKKRKGRSQSTQTSESTTKSKENNNNSSTHLLDSPDTVEDLEKSKVVTASNSHMIENDESISLTEVRNHNCPKVDEDSSSTAAEQMKEESAISDTKLTVQNNNSSDSSVDSSPSIVTCKSVEVADLSNNNNRTDSIASSVLPGITMSRVNNGVSGSYVVGGGRIEDTDEVDNEVWETVEPKGGRSAGKKKQTTTNNNGNNRSLMERSGLENSSATTSSSRNRSNKGRGKQRRNNMKMKLAKDIINSILDRVDSEITQQKRVAGISLEERKKINEERRMTSDQNKTSVSSYLEASVSNSKSTKVASLRDVLIGKVPKTKPPSNSGSKQVTNVITAVGKTANQTSAKQDTQIDKIRTTASPTKHRPSSSQRIHSRLKSDYGIASLSNKQGSQISIDQNTAPTVPETLSGVSTTTQSSCATEIERRNIRRNNVVKESETKTENRNSIIEGSPENEFPFRSSVTCRSDDEDDTTALADVANSNAPPPLSTLLGPGNENSASSSVDSSLDAPHASRYRTYRRGFNGKDDDVGCHLLDVCERLSNDMSSFMQRRSLALHLKRRERGAILSCLQDTVQNIWSGRCHVEMYGSCATQLDLPSSDLDVVVCGFDRRDEIGGVSQNVNNNTKFLKNRHKKSIGTEDDAFITDEYNSHLPESENQEPTHHHAYQHHQYYPPPSKNGARVLSLASELERQPWAVQVKAIPTATVPVIKFLADPSRLPGADSAGIEWVMSHQHMNNSQATGSGPSKAMDANNSNSSVSDAPPSLVGIHHSQSSPFNGASPPWRGADVMNGLLSVDITFEGPEHGGIGSTAFSAQVVQDACNETGLPPESTAAVQVIMVIKELLAQKRLNEPFSGGLSSYAIMLLVLAVMKERRAIREEMERIEHQRRAVAAECSAGICNSSDTERQNSISGSKNTNENDKSVGDTARAKSKVHCDAVDHSVSREKDTDKIEQQSHSSITRENSSSNLKNSDTNTQSTVSHPSIKSSWADIAMNKSFQKVGSSTNLSSVKSISSSSLANSETVISPKDDPKTCIKQSEHKNNDSDNTRAKIRKDPSLPSSHSNVNNLEKAELGHDNGRGTRSSVSSKEEYSMKNSIKSPMFPQGSNDVLEVLCSGEMTAGKLLMHFLLFYGQLFEAQSTCVDVSGKQHPEYNSKDNAKESETCKCFGQLHLSPFVPRKSGGSYDPITGVYSVDPVVVYDPLEGSETNNVSRSCFAWSSIRWVFAQCYVTLSGVVERGAGLTSDRNGNEWSRQVNSSLSNLPQVPTKNQNLGPSTSNSTPPRDADGGLLELLISF